jgi:hypothetical protein
VEPWVCLGEGDGAVLSPCELKIPSWMAVLEPEFVGLLPPLLGSLVL